MSAERMEEGLPDRARALLDGADFIDLHVDSFIAVRALGYDIGAFRALRS